MDKECLNNIINQLDLIKIYGTLYPTIIENTSFSNEIRIFSNILSHKSLNNFTQIQVIQSIFSYQMGIKLEIREYLGYPYYLQTVQSGP